MVTVPFFSTSTKLSVCTAVICSTLTRISLEGAGLIGVPSRFAQYNLYV